MTASIEALRVMVSSAYRLSTEVERDLPATDRGYACVAIARHQLERAATLLASPELTSARRHGALDALKMHQQGACEPEVRTMASTREKPVCETARTWLRNRNGRNAFAAFHAGTSRAFSSYLHLVELWMVGGCAGGREAVVPILRHAVALLQRAEWKMAAEAIAAIGDWSHIDELWPQIKPPAAPFYWYDGDQGVVAGDA